MPYGKLRAAWIASSRNRHRTDQTTTRKRRWRQLLRRLGEPPAGDAPTRIEPLEARLLLSSTLPANPLSELQPGVLQDEQRSHGVAEIEAGLQQTASASAVPGVFGPVWSAVGPAPQDDANPGSVDVPPNHEVTGAVHTVLAHPNDADTLYIGSVNGGVWKTTNATDANPDWTPLTDFMPSLSVGALEFDPTDTSYQTLVMGIGNKSSFNGFGGPLNGVWRSTNGGATWNNVSTPLLDGENISSVAARGDVLLAASDNTWGGGRGRGLFRSTDGGATWSQISGSATSGLPSGRVSDLVPDSGDTTRFYAGVLGFNAGVYRSGDTGRNWTAVNSGLGAVGTNTTKIELAVHDSVGNNSVYAAALNGGRLNNGQLYQSTNQGGSWTALDTPNTGGQGNVHFGITADPTDPDVVYVRGQSGGQLIDASNSRGSQITSLTGGSAGFPHADTREMTFDANGDLLETDDGGIHRLTDPRSSSRQWESVIGNLQLQEIHSLAYDSLTDTLIAGSQDNGTGYQRSPGSDVWQQVWNADGGDVAVDNQTNAGSNQSIRYFSQQNLPFLGRDVYDSSNNSVNRDRFGTGTVSDGQFVTPIALNAADPSKIVIGGNNTVYEGTVSGSGLSISAITSGVGVNGWDDDPVAYGGFLGNSPNEDVLYVADNAPDEVYVRTSGSGAPSATGWPGGHVTDIALDPDDWRTAYVGDRNGDVYQTSDAGNSWVNITGNLDDADPQNIVVVNGDGGDADHIYVGGRDGVYRTQDDETLSTWLEYGTNLPNVAVWELEYSAQDDQLFAGTFGRGVFATASLSILPVAEQAIELNPFGDATFTDTFADATPLGQDVLRFASDTSGNFEVDVSSSSGSLDPAVRLWNEETDELVDANLDGGSGVDAARVTETLNFWDSSLIEVFAESGSGRYDISVNGPDQTVVDVDLDPNGDATENDRLEAMTDSDYFRLDVPLTADGQLDVTLTPDSGSNLNGVMNVYTGSGQEIIRVDQNGFGGSESFTFADVDPGETFYIRVGSDFYSTDGDYELDIDFGQKLPTQITPGGVDGNVIFHHDGEAINATTDEPSIDFAQAQESFYFAGDNGWSPYYLFRVNDGGSADVDPMIAVYDDSTGELLAFDDDTGPGDAAALLMTNISPQTRLQAVIAHDPTQNFGGPESVNFEIDSGSITSPRTLNVNAVGNASASDSLGADADSDFFEFTAPAGTDDLLAVSVDPSAGLDAAVGVFNNQGELIGNLDLNGAGVEETVGLTGIMPGQTYHATVLGSNYDSSGSYDLRVDFNVPDRFEPNDFAGEAHDLGGGDVTENDLSIHKPGDDDFYRWTPAADGTVTVETFFNHQDGDLDLELLDANGNVIAGSASISDDEQLSASVNAGDDYLIRVYGFDNALNTYDLQIDGPGLAIDRFEDNDTFAAATEVPEGDRFLADLTIDEAGDDDFYRWTAKADGTLEVSAFFTHADGDLDVELLDANQNRLALANSVNDNESLSHPVTAGNDYIVRVYGFSQETNTYSLDFDGPGLRVDRLEPNDTRDTAYDLGAGDRSAGDLTIHAAGNSDYYRWTAAASGTVNVSLEVFDQGSNLDLELLDANGNAVASSNTMSDVENLSASVSIGEDYFVRVFGVGEAVSSYSVDVDGPVAPDSLEANNNFDSPHDLGSGDRSESDLTIHSETDEDYYRWTAPTDGELTVDLIFPHADPDLDLDLEIFDSRQNRLDFAASTTDDESLSIAVTEGTEYIIHVFGFREAQNTYDLQLDAPGLPADRFEDNETVNAAADLASYDRTEEGLTIDAANDVDFYEWTAPAAGTLDVDALFPHDGGDLKLALLNAAGDTIVTSNSTTDNESVSAPVQFGQTYRIRVEGEGRQTNVYDLQIDGPDLPIDRFEDNNTFSTAPDLGPGDRTESGLTIHEPVDSDFYRWIAPADGSLRVDVLFTQTDDDLDLDLEIYDSTQLLIGESRTSDDNEQATASVVGGQDYFIRVFGFEGSVNRYDLRIDGPDDAAPRVTQVLTRSTGWGDNFLGQLAERELGFGGFAIGSGPQQLGAMPWQNVNEVVIRFSEDVNVQARDLVLEGVNLPVISEVGFSYDPESFEATWTLAGPLPTDKLLIDLSDAVTDEAGNRLDGEWINPSAGEAAPPPSDFPSGDGQPGGNFRFRFNLARGDSNGDGSISVLDIAPLRNAIGQSVGSEGYDPLADYNADGANSVLDIPNLRDNIGQALPEGDPRDPDFPEDVPFDQGVGETPTREQPVVDEPNRDTADLLAGPTSAVRASAGPESAAAMQTALISQQRRSIDASRHGNADAENQGGLDARGTDDLGDGLLDSLLRDPEEDEATLDALRLANEQLNR